MKVLTQSAAIVCVCIFFSSKINNIFYSQMFSVAKFARTIDMAYIM